MCVADRVMGNSRAYYNPMESVVEERGDVVLNEMTDNERKVQAKTTNGETNTENSIGITNAPNFIQSVIARVGQFNDLKGKWKHAKLNNALIRLKSLQSNST